MKREDVHAQDTDAGVHAAEDPFVFVPLPLRQHFHVEDVDNQEEHTLVQRVRQTRSAQLVASLLYDARSPSDDGVAAVVARKVKKTQSKSPMKKTKTTAASPVASTNGPESLPLYSLAIEQAIAKRMAFTRAVKQLDAYFNELAVTVAALESRNSVEWLWDANTKLPTMLQLQRRVVQSVAGCLPDCDVYLAMYEPLPMAHPEAATPWPLLRYAAASPQSRMAGQTLQRTPSAPDKDEASVSSFVSFDVLDSLDPALVPDISADTRVQFVVEAADVTRVRTGPFACLPLVDACGSRGIGVLAVDACRKAAQLRPESMSPQTLFEFLTRMQIPEAAIEFRKLQFGGRQLLQLTANDLQHRPAYRTLKIQAKQRVLEIVAALRSGFPIHLPRGERPSFFCDDDEALELLDEVCERAGEFLDEYRRRVHWHRIMAKRTRDVKASVLDVYTILVHGIAEALVGVERVSIWKIRDCTQIDAIATTHIPDDRLLPFLQWNERQIRRLVLYAEDNEDQGQLMQGNITRIHLPAASEHGHQSCQSGNAALQPCERAVYHVTWSNRTQQSLSWPKLRQLLPIRTMNARHYQLSQLLKRLVELKDDHNGDHDALRSGLHFRLVDPSALVILLRDPHRPENVVYALQVDLVAHVHRDAAAEIKHRDDVGQFVRRAVEITQQNVFCVRGRDMRSFRRQLSTVKTTRNFSSIGLTPSSDALRALDEIVGFVFSEISTNLPGTLQQIAELQSDGTQLLYTFTGGGSSLAGKTLTRPQGVSFRCVDARTPVVISQDSELRNRLRCIAPVIDMDAELPYAIVPLIHEDACIGVLSVNHFVNVPKGRTDEMHPEDGVVDYLTALAKPLAAAIYLKRRSFALHRLHQLHLEPIRSPEQLFLAACNALQDSMIGSWKTRVMEVDFARGKCTLVFDYTEAARLQAATVIAQRVVPLSFRVKELLPETVRGHWQITGSEVNVLVKLCVAHEDEVTSAGERAIGQLAINGTSSAIEVQRRKDWEWLVRQRYYGIRLQPLEDVKVVSTKVASSSPSKKSDLTVAARATNEKYLSHALTTALSSKTVTYADVPALTIGSSSAVYLIVATLPQFHAMCEQHFVDRVASVLSRMMEALVQRVERSRVRVASLDALSVECTRFIDQSTASMERVPTKSGGFPLSAQEELRLEAALDLMDRVVRLISSTLMCPNVYVALHEPLHRRLTYISASNHSSMKGKILHRGHGVSFFALDAHKPVVIKASTTIDELKHSYGSDSSLRYFSSDAKESQKWPFIVVPIGTAGILALDNLQKYEMIASEAQPELGLVDFLLRAGDLVGDAVAAVRRGSLRMRRQRREEALVRVMAACETVGRNSSSLYVQQVVLQAIESALNGVDAYIGLVQPLSESMIFTSATARSGMANQKLNTVDSVSFRVFLSQHPLVIPQVERKQFDASKKNATELVSQLRWFTPAQAQGRKGPFVCVPIPFVGVLSVDSFPGAASGIYSPQVPEYGVVSWLNQIANLLGATIRQMAAADALRAIPKLFEGNRSTLRSVFVEVLKIISTNVVSAVELSVLTYDKDSSRPICGADAPLAAVTTSVSHYKDDSDATVRSLESSIQQQLQAKSSDETRCFMLPSHPEVIVVRCADVRDVEYDATEHRATEWLDACPLRKSLLVVRRVRGASWEYDVEFLQSLVPLLDEVVELVNLRVCGIAARQNALSRLEALCMEIEHHASARAAYDLLPQFLDDALCLVVQAASQVPGDAYLGERQIGGEVLRYVAASSSSLMRNIELQLLPPESQNMVVVQAFLEGHKAIVQVPDNSKGDTALRPLTSKKVHRVFIALPMGESRVLCVDSLSAEAFDVLHGRIEKDVEAFLEACAALLEATISSVNFRRSYDDLCSLKTERHLNFRRFFARVHEILRRDLCILHSQQVLELANDFTGQFTVRSWHRASTRRPIRGAFPPHFCSVNGCTREGIALDIHHEQHVELPMTNLPRTLDQSRATTQPVVGREKQGAFACDCLATMLDSELPVLPKLALCVYSHDETSSGIQDKVHTRANRSTRTARLPTAFTIRQRQYFTAFGAVVSDVYADVFRACVLETFSTEALFIARDRLCAKDAVLLSVNMADDGTSDGVRVVTGSSIPTTKWMPGSQVTAKLADKVLGFYHNAENAEFLIVQTKRAQISSAKPPPSSPARTLKTTDESIDARNFASPASGRFLFKRPRLFGGKQSQEAAAKNTSISAQPPIITPLPPKPIVEFHVLVRGHHKGEVLSLYLDRELDEERDAVAELATETRAMIDDVAATRDRFLDNPQGDEEWNGAGFGHVLEIGEGMGFGGGGFHVLACWNSWRRHVQSDIVHFEADMRSYLTGVQATSRDQLGARVAGAVRPRLLATQGHGNHPEESVFSHDNTATRSAAMVLVRVALLLCGFKKEIAIDSPADEDDNLLKEYLRANAGRKVLDLNPRLASRWAVTLRAGNFIKTKFAVVNWIVNRELQPSNLSLRAARVLLLFIQSYNSAVKYFKFLQDNAKVRKQRVDTTITVIQCFCRCIQAKALLKRLRIEFKAALAIQCAFRQHLARRRRLFLKWNRAAVTVQRAFRRKIARRRGRRPRKLTLELRTVAAQYGTMQATNNGALKSATTLDEGDGSWKTEMASFDSFKTYLASRVGREQLKREEHVITERLKEVVRHREQLNPHDRLLADAHDVFEILDSDGRGELSRELTRDLMTRLHVPLSREETDDVIDMMDNDHSGSISFAEFTNWFSHEFSVLKKRSRECGVLLKRDRQWMVEESARSALRKRWRAHQQIGNEASVIGMAEQELPISTPAPAQEPSVPAALAGGPKEDVAGDEEPVKG